MENFKKKDFRKHFWGAVFGIGEDRAGNIINTAEETAQRLAKGAVRLGITQLNKILDVEEVSKNNLGNNYK